MKAMKKMMALALAGVMAVSCLAGCGGDAKETTAAAGETTAATSEEGTFLIGGIGPITGGAAVYGTAVMNGAQIAVDEINAAGGVNGMKLALNFQDDEHDAEKSVNAYNTLKDAGIKVLMGTVTSDPCIAVVEKTAADNMFQLTPSGSAVPCISGDNAFRICFNDPAQGGRSAEYIKNQNLGSNIAVIYDSSNAYSTGIYENFLQGAAAQGLNVVAAEAFTADSNTDFTVQLKKIAELNPDLVFLPIYYQEAALILKQASTEGMELKFFGCDGLDGVIDQLGEDAALAEGVMLLTPFVYDQDDASKAFSAEYEKRFGGIPNQFAADAYDAIYVIKAALEKAGVTNADIDPSELCDLLKAAMLEIEVQGLTGTMTWDAEGECSKEPKGMVIKDGNYTSIE